MDIAGVVPRYLHATFEHHQSFVGAVTVYVRVSSKDYQQHHSVSSPHYSYLSSHVSLPTLAKHSCIACFRDSRCRPWHPGGEDTALQVN